MLFVAITFLLVTLICAIGDAAAGPTQLREVFRVLWITCLVIAVFMFLLALIAGRDDARHRAQSNVLLTRAVAAEKHVYAAQGAYGNTVDLQAADARLASLPAAESVEVALGSRGQVVRITVSVGNGQGAVRTRLLRAPAPTVKGS